MNKGQVSNPAIVAWGVTRYGSYPVPIAEGQSQAGYAVVYRVTAARGSSAEARALREQERLNGRRKC